MVGEGDNSAGVGDSGDSDRRDVWEGRGEIVLFMAIVCTGDKMVAVGRGVGDAGVTHPLIRININIVT